MLTVHKYRDLNSFFKKLYQINQLWFKNRSAVKSSDVAVLFDMMLEVDAKMSEIYARLNDTKKTKSFD